MTLSGHLLAAGVALATAFGSANAADCTGTFGWYAVGPNVGLEDGHSVFTGHFSGTFVANDTAGVMHLNAVQCPGIYDIDNGKTTSSGYCWQADADGDKVFYRWSCEGELPVCSGPFSAYAGTGKFEGITAEGTFRAVTSNVNAMGEFHGYAVWETCEYSLP
jgi:hypothetical protein